MCLVSKAQSGRGRLFSKYLFPTKLSVCSTTHLNSSDEDQNKKQYQSILDGVAQNVSEPNELKLFSSFLSKKHLALPLNGFPISPFDVHLLELPPQTTITSRSGGRCRFFMRVFSVRICKRAFRSGVEPHAANHKSSKWDACRLFMRIERRFDQVMFDWITSKFGEQNK